MNSHPSDDQNDKNWVVVGRFGRPHGLKGYVSVYSFTEPGENILKYKDWYAQINGHWTLLDILAVEQHVRCSVVLVAGYQDRDQVGRLTNLDIAVQSDQLPRLSNGEYYWSQLIGMTVVNTSGAALGLVVEMIATGANDVLVVQGDERYLIPYRYGVVVLDVCELTRQITVDWDGEYQ